MIRCFIRFLLKNSLVKTWKVAKGVFETPHLTYEINVLTSKL